MHKKYSIGEWLGRATAFIGIASALAYASGWLYLQKYWATLGAPWYLVNESPQAILGAGLPIMKIILVGAVGAYFFMWKSKSSRQAAYFSLFLLVVGIAAYAYAMYLPIDSPSRASFAKLYWFVMGFNAGFTLGEWIWGFGFSDYKWAGQTWTALMVWFILLNLPAQTAEIDARANMNPATSTLAMVISPALRGDWRLMRVSGDVALVVLLNSNPKERAFKLLRVVDVEMNLLPPAFVPDASASSGART